MQNNKIKINSEIFKNTPKLISLMETAKKYGLNIDTLTSDEISRFAILVLVTSR